MGGITVCPCAEAQRTESAVGGKNACAVIVAGGSGERFGDPRGKQFVELLGLPLVGWSILAFDRAPSVGHVVVVCPTARVDEMRDSVIAKLDLQHEVTLAAAGPTRQDSVLSGLMAVPEELELVAIHDGARPLIDTDAIEACLAAVRMDKQVSGAICASRQTDTLKVVDVDGKIVSTPNRSAFWCAQTPQVFRRSVIVAAHETALLAGYAGTDDASLVEHMGGTVRVVETSRDNIKITMPEDLAIAEAILRSRVGIA